IDAHVDEESRQRRFGKIDVRLERAALQPREEDALDAPPDLRVVLVARHVYETGDEAVERVAAQEHAGALALLQRAHALRDAAQVLDRDLEELVARIGLEDMAERLACVARGRETRALDHRGDLVPQQRDVARAAAVRERREEPEEAPLAVGIAVLVESLDA